MTVPDFAARLKEHLNVTSISAMESGDRLRLADAVNQGLQDFYLRAPQPLKEGSLTGLLPAPRTQSLGLVQGSRAVTGYAFAEGDIYQSVVIGGRLNRLVPGNLLLYPWEGATGTHEARIYGDAATWAGNEPVLERLAGTPVLEDATPLAHVDRGLGAGEIIEGRPTHSTVEHYGKSLSVVPSWCLRVWPLPDVAYRIRIPVHLTAYTVTSAQLTDTAAVMPLEDRHLVRFVAPISLFHLSSHRLWKLPETRNVILQQYEAALIALARLPSQQHAPANRAHTPRGY